MPALALINTIGGLLKITKINKTITINYYFNSTSLYPDCQGQQIQDLNKDFTYKYPKHAYIFRYLTSHTDKQRIENISHTGYLMIPSRQVYIFDKTLCKYSKKRVLKRDTAIIKKRTDYQIVSANQIMSSDYPRIANLYHQLFIDKHAKHNPQFTIEMVAHWHKHKRLHFTHLRNQQDQLDGVVACFENNLSISILFVGYDTSLPQTLGLYRILIKLALDYAQSKNKIVNMSAGSPNFKIKRGGQAFVQYTAVYVKNLQLYRRLTWQLLNKILRKFMLPVLKSQKL